MTLYLLETQLHATDNLKTVGWISIETLPFLETEVIQIHENADIFSDEIVSR